MIAQIDASSRTPHTLIDHDALRRLPVRRIVDRDVLPAIRVSVGLRAHESVG